MANIDVNRWQIITVSQREGLLFWSNEWGWTTCDLADEFNEQERDTLSLPIGGIWVKTVYDLPAESSEP